MKLVQAIGIACKRSVLRQEAKRLCYYLLSWIYKIQEFFPLLSPWLNMHMSTHIADFIELFGPTPSWWTFPFERLIGEMLRIPTNGAAGTCFTLL
jgi:hypothetical protein